MAVFCTDDDGQQYKDIYIAMELITAGEHFNKIVSDCSYKLLNFSFHHAHVLNLLQFLV